MTFQKLLGFLERSVNKTISGWIYSQSCTISPRITSQCKNKGKGPAKRLLIWIHNVKCWKYLNIYRQWLYLEPKWPLLWLEFWPCLERLTFKNRGCDGVQPLRPTRVLATCLRRVFQSFRWGWKATEKFQIWEALGSLFGPLLWNISNICLTCMAYTICNIVCI